MRATLYASGVLAFAIFHGATASAAGVEGLWASEASICSKIFERKGGHASFTKDSDSYGSGMIIEGGRIVGKMGTCVIVGTRREGNLHRLQSRCTTDISQEDLQVSLRLVNADKIVRIFPDIPEMETEYVRCPSK